MQTVAAVERAVRGIVRPEVKEAVQQLSHASITSESGYENPTGA